MSETNFLDNYVLEGENLEISVYPAAVLKKKAEEVTEFNDELKETAKNMLYTMYNAPGVGLAAPQVGISKRFFVMDVDYDRESVTNADGKEEIRLSNFNPRIVVNPVIKNKSGEIVHEEGCLSVPGIYEEVKRAESITLEYQDIEGKHHSIDAHEMEAICIQHENDHLDGIVFLERLSLMKKKFLKKKFLKERNK